MDAKKHSGLHEQLPPQDVWQVLRQHLERLDYEARKDAQQAFRTEVASREGIREENLLRHFQPGFRRQLRDLLRVEQKNVAICVRLELRRLEDRRVRAVGEFWEPILKLGAVWRRHDDVTAGPDELRNFAQ